MSYLIVHKPERAYKSLSTVERAFRSYKTVDLKIRPIHHRLAVRVRSRSVREAQTHVFLCMLAYYVEWHMRSVLATLLFDDEQQLCSRLPDDSPVAPASRSPKALRKTRSKRTEDNFPVHSFGTILADLATIVKNRVQPKLSKVEVTFDKITCPTRLQQKALDLLGVSL